MYYNNSKYFFKKMPRGRPRETNPKKQIMTVRLDNNQLQEFKRLCKKAQRTPSELLRLFVEGVIAGYKDSPEDLRKYDIDDIAAPHIDEVVYRYDRKRGIIQYIGLQEESGKEVCLAEYPPEMLKEDAKSLTRAIEDWEKHKKSKHRQMGAKVRRCRRKTK